MKKKEKVFKSLFDMPEEKRNRFLEALKKRKLFGKNKKKLDGKKVKKLVIKTKKKKVVEKKKNTLQEKKNQALPKSLQVILQSFAKQKQQVKKPLDKKQSKAPLKKRVQTKKQITSKKTQQTSPKSAPKTTTPDVKLPKVKSSIPPYVMLEISRLQALLQISRDPALIGSLMAQLEIFAQFYPSASVVIQDTISTYLKERSSIEEKNFLAQQQIQGGYNIPSQPLIIVGATFAFKTIGDVVKLFSDVQQRSERENIIKEGEFAKHKTMGDLGRELLNEQGINSISRKEKYNKIIEQSDFLDTKNKQQNAQTQNTNPTAQEPKEAMLVQQMLNENKEERTLSMRTKYGEQWEKYKDILEQALLDAMLEEYLKQRIEKNAEKSQSQKINQQQENKKQANVIKPRQLPKKRFTERYIEEKNTQKTGRNILL
jgi:hypothetical protein